MIFYMYISSYHFGALQAEFTQVPCRGTAVGAVKLSTGLPDMDSMIDLRAISLIIWNRNSGTNPNEPTPCQKATVWLMHDMHPCYAFMRPGIRLHALPETSTPHTNFL